MKARYRWILLIASIFLLVAVPAVAAATFADVPATHPFYANIQSLVGKNIISGYADGTFRPDNPVLRAQLAKIIVLAADKHTPIVDNAGAPSFDDVVPAMGVLYPFDFVEEAAKAGFVQGTVGGLFRPYERLTRVQLALVLVRAGGTALTPAPAGYKTGFSDVPTWAQKAVATCKYNGLLDGKTATTFDPYSWATRGHVCKTVDRLLLKTRAGMVKGTTATPSAQFSAIATRVNAVLALGYNTTNPDVVAKVLFDDNPSNDPVVIDTREPEDYAKGHIPGAVNIPLKSLPQALLVGDARVPMDKETIIASYWGDDGDLGTFLVNLYRIKDPVAQKAAIDGKLPLPYPKSTALFQGMTSWSFERELVPANTRFEDAQKAGIVVQKPVVPGVIAGSDQASYPTFGGFATDDIISMCLLRAKDYFAGFQTQFGIHVYPSAVAAELADGNSADDPQIISVRSATDYAAGHVPGAINIPYQKVADVANFTKFVKPGSPVVVYCYTGHTGGLATIALGILGYDVKNLLYGMNGWNTAAPGAGQLKDFDLMKGWDFPVVTGAPGELTSLAAYVPPSGCVGCHGSLTGIFYDREVADPPAGAVAAPSEGEG